jgi:hypothetical protein
MKLDRLTSASALPRAGSPSSRPSGTGARPVAPVAAAAETDPDRRRSGQQDLEEMEARAMGPFDGEEQVWRLARELAEKLARLGPEANRLVRAGGLRPPRHTVDDQA